MTKNYITQEMKDYDGPRWRFATHHCPHFDEILAMWLAYRYGKEKIFRCLVMDGIRLYNAGTLLEEGQDYPSLLQEYYIALGILKGDFDEHGLGTVKTQCCATLMYDYLNFNDQSLDKIPGLLKLVHYVLEQDSGRGHEFDLGYCVKILHLNGAPLDGVIKWVFLILDAYMLEAQRNKKKEKKGLNLAALEDGLLNWLTLGYSENEIANLVRFVRSKAAHPFGLRYLTAVAEMHLLPTSLEIWLNVIFQAERRLQASFDAAVHEVAAAEKFVSVEGKFQAVAIQSDNPKLLAAARKAGLNLIIQRKSTGHMVIGTSMPVAGETEIYAALQKAELEKGGEAEDSDKIWHYPFPGFVFNGSDSAPSVPTTSLTLEEVKYIIVKIVDSNFKK